MVLFNLKESYLLPPGNTWLQLELINSAFLLCFFRGLIVALFDPGSYFLLIILCLYFYHLLAKSVL